MSNIKPNFSEFLTQTLKIKEVSLVIAQDENEQEAIQKLLTEANFINISDIFELMEKVSGGGQYFLIIDSETTAANLKNYYDFIIQYPTGQIEIFNQAKSASVIANPNDQATIILLITKTALSDCQQQNFNFLNIVGLTYQS